MDKQKQKEKSRRARKFRIRQKISGTQERPRLCVRRTINHMIAQVVDDSQARSLAQVSSHSKEVKARAGEGGGKKEKSRAVGNLIAEKVMALGIKKVVFDRSGFLYHGRIKALADGAREKGLEF